MELPQEFLERMKDLLAEDYNKYLESFKEEPAQGIRVNTSKISVKEFRCLAPFELRPIPWVKNGFYVKKEDAVTRHPYYYAGLYYVQEPSAMTPASRLPVEKGDRILDLCAAPGGKSTELGSRLRGSGFLLANDISNSRAKGLLKNLEQFGLGNICVSSESPEKLAGYYPDFFDKILIDAPCSGEGMFRKDPGMVKSYREHGPEYYREIQRGIVDTAVKMLKPGGKLLYSTCTFSPLENEGVIEEFLSRHPDMRVLSMEGCQGFSKGIPSETGNREMEQCIRIFPHRVEGEGHFAALLGKEERAWIHSSVEEKDKQEQLPPSWMDFQGTCLKTDFSHCRIIEMDHRLYAVPKEIPMVKGVRFLRTGLYLGEDKKNRFEPSQALAMYLSRKDVASSISFPAKDQRIFRYLKGETLELSLQEAEGLKSWCLICVDGYPLGWGKWVNGSLRNKYYSGWRMG